MDNIDQKMVRISLEGTTIKFHVPVREDLIAESERVLFALGVITYDRLTQETKDYMGAHKL